MTLSHLASGERHSPVPAGSWSVRLIQSGKLQEIRDGDSPWTTAIYKTPLTEQVTVDRLGIVGDEHTGAGRTADRALCCHPLHHYAYWNAYFRTVVPIGTFGENLTLAGLGEQDLCIGDVLRCGSVLMQVSQPRMPCSKQARRIRQPEFVKLILESGKTGFLTRILEPGTIQVDDPLQLVERPLPEVPLLFVLHVFHAPDPDAAALLASTSLLATEWRERFASPRLSAR